MAEFQQQPHSCEYCRRVVIDPAAQQKLWRAGFREPLWGQRVDAGLVFEGATNGCPFLCDLLPCFRRRSFRDLSAAEKVKVLAEVEAAPNHGAILVTTLKANTSHDVTNIEGFWDIRPTENLSPLRRDFAVYSKPGLNLFQNHLNYLVVSRASFKTNRLKDSSSSGWISSRPGSFDLGSDYCFDVLKAKLSECIERHDLCRKPPRPGLDAGFHSPWRLIDLEASISGPVRLVLGTHCPSPVLYCTLSYCWGGDQLQKTTTSNINERLRGFDPGLQPKTIVDAIEVTKRLGFRYLWVDSLCIVQDDVDERDVELGRMQHIYRSSQLTISAANASASSDGFIRLCKEPERQYQLPYRTATGDISTVFLCEYEDMDSHDPIHKRAWTLQEHILSRRLAVFASTGLRYCCLTEHYTHGLDGNLNALGLSHSSAERPDRMQFAAESTPALTKFHHWHSFVGEAHRRDLTFPSDRLNVISAIARELSSHSDNERYLAGLWQSRLSKALLWEVDHSDRETAVRDQSPNFPSWSWASVSRDSIMGISELTYIESWKFLDKVRLLGSNVTLLSPNTPFGQVVNGTLRLRGRLFPAVCHTVGEYSMGIFPWPRYLSKSCCATLHVDITNEQQASHEPSLPPELGVILDVEGELAEKQLCYYLETLLATDFRINTFSHGLVLIREGSKTQTFRRVGKGALQHIPGPEFYKFGGSINFDAAESVQGAALAKWGALGCEVDFDLV